MALRGSGDRVHKGVGQLLQPRASVFRRWAKKCQETAEGVQEGTANLIPEGKGTVRVPSLVIGPPQLRNGGSGTRRIRELTFQARPGSGTTGAWTRMCSG